MLAGTRSFRDHHRYTDADVRDLLRLRQQAGAPAFVTTEKDAVNLGAHLQALQPIHVVPVRMQLENRRRRSRCYAGHDCRAKAAGHVRQSTGSAVPGCLHLMRRAFI